MTGRRWTEDELAEADAIHETGVEWAAVAARYGATVESLKSARRRRDKNRRRGGGDIAPPDAKSTADICGDWRVIGRKREGDSPIRWQYVGMFADPRQRAVLRAEIGQGRILGASRLHTRPDGTREWLWLVRLPAQVAGYRRAA